MAWWFINDPAVDFDVIPMKIASPLHQFVTDRSLGGSIRFARAGPPVRLLQWHCEEGFPFVQEKILKKLLADFGIEEPNVPTDGADPRIPLKLAAIRNFKPGCLPFLCQCVQLLLDRRH